MAAAIGAGLPIHEPMGNLVVDIGGGTTEVALISLGGIVTNTAVRVGGFDLDGAIQNYIRKEYRLAIGERTAERIKIAIASAFPLADEKKAELRGRDLATGLPKNIVMSSEEMRKRHRRAGPRVRGRDHRLHQPEPSRSGPGRADERHHSYRWRRNASGSRHAPRARRPRSPSTSRTSRSSQWCSAPASASRHSRAQNPFFCTPRLSGALPPLNLATSSI